MNCFFCILLICFLAPFVLSGVDEDFEKMQNPMSDPEIARRHTNFASRVPSATHFIDVAAFDDFLEKHEQSLVIFVDTSYDKMVEYANAFETVASKYKDEIPVAIVDAATNMNFAFLYEMTTYPTILRFIRSEDTLLYSFPEVTEKHLMNFMKIKTGKKHPTEVKTIQDVKELVKDYSVVLGLFESVDDEDYKNFVQVASNMERVSDTFVYVIASKEKLEEFKQAFSPQTQGNIIVIPIAGYPEFESLSFSSDDKLDTKKLFVEISTVRLPVFGQVTEGLFKSYQMLNKVHLWFLMTPEKVEEYKKDIIKVVNPFRGRMISFWLNNSTDSNQAESLYLNLNSIPSVCITNPNDPDRHLYYYAKKTNEKFSIEGLQNFIASYFANTLTPSLISEELSEQELNYSDDKIGKLSADVHDRILSNSNYTHVVFYTHEKCEECKPLYEHLQQLLENRSQFSTEETKFRFYSINCARNQIPEYVPGQPFPPLGLYRNDKRLFFVGSWKDDNVLNFLKNPSEETAIAGFEERKVEGTEEERNQELEDEEMENFFASKEPEPHDEMKKEL